MACPLYTWELSISLEYAEQARPTFFQRTLWTCCRDGFAQDESSHDGKAPWCTSSRPELRELHNYVLYINGQRSGACSRISTNFDCTHMHAPPRMDTP